MCLLFVCHFTSRQLRVTPKTHHMKFESVGLEDLSGLSKPALDAILLGLNISRSRGQRSREPRDLEEPDPPSIWFHT